MRGYEWRSEEVLWKAGTSYDEHHETRDHFRPCLGWLGTVCCNDGHWFSNHVAAKCAHHPCHWRPYLLYDCLSDLLQEVQLYHALSNCAHVRWLCDSGGFLCGGARDQQKFGDVHQPVGDMDSFRAH